MFAGHLGVALAASRVERRVNLGVFAVASLLLDALLWLFILLGWESVALPDHFPQTHQPAFEFPCSHGLFASVLWAGLAGTVAFAGTRMPHPQRWRLALLVAAVVASHWWLDALVHRPEMPVAGAASPRVGLGLWNHMPLALGVEAALILAGLGLYLPGCGLSPRRRLALVGFSLLVLAFTVVGMTLAPAPPSAAAMAGSSLGAVALVCGLLAWLDRAAVAQPA